MSSRLSWAPVAIPQGNTLDSGLKFILRKRYGEPINKAIGPGEIPYVQGLVDADVPGAKTLLAALKEHEHIHLRESY